MTNEMKTAVQAIVDSTICSFAEGLPRVTCRLICLILAS